jgi:hypothetical protein
MFLCVIKERGRKEEREREKERSNERERDPKKTISLWILPPRTNLNKKVWSGIQI